MTVLIVICITTAALILGALWGAYVGLGRRTEGFVVALAGGALIVSVMDELIRPSVDPLTLWGAIAAILAGAALFSAGDYWVNERLRNSGGAGMMLAVTLDGVPENLALGSALIGADALAVAALAGSIFLSNLPEAAGGARQMISDGRSRWQVLALWSAVAALLAAAAYGGYAGLSNAPKPLLATINCFAAGAVLASLATEVFPKAFREDSEWTGIAVAIGLSLALALSQLG
ncbi:zinc transporter [Arenibacterium halophilum]|uniref:Zinc transporter n=1 Tax=Arenibacterium halophilum TaxID=2583821 RepID=A0ABY2XEE2_9RHOB|nr:zinc transporter [Arenibacterium halophilum]TMV15399.1 zinc transporter [Arenibacterium halophilum]